MANYDSNNVTRILKSDLSTTTIAVGTNPGGIAVDETYCWVANWGSDNVTHSMVSVKEIALSVVEAIEEISDGTEQISSAVKGLSDISRRLI